MSAIGKSMTIGSLFSGVGGLELGLERAGLGPVLWQVEIDPFCRQVLAKHWPNAKRYTDVKEINANAQKVDIICGGFPCQDVSNAGKRAGLDGERSGLWSEYARIVRELRPRFVVVENVSALLARGVERVLGDLAACGYDAEWDCVPASAIGAPHQRDRLFILAWHVSDAERDRGGLEPERGGAQQAERWHANIAHVRAELADRDERRREGERLARRESGHEGAPRHEPDGRGGEALANADRERRLEGRAESSLRERRPDAGELGAWPPGPDDMHAWGGVPALAQPSFCRLADGVPAGLVRSRRGALKAYGNAVVPAVGWVIGRRLVEIADARRAA